MINNADVPSRMINNGDGAELHDQQWTPQGRGAVEPCESYPMPVRQARSSTAVDGDASQVTPDRCCPPAERPATDERDR